MGVLLQGGVWSQGGVCSGGVCLLQRGGCLLQGGGCGVPACTEADTPSVNRMTDRCKNITLATTSLQPGNKKTGKVRVTSVSRVLSISQCFAVAKYICCKDIRLCFSIM